MSVEEDNSTPVNTDQERVSEEDHDHHITELPETKESSDNVPAQEEAHVDTPTQTLNESEVLRTGEDSEVPNSTSEAKSDSDQQMDFVESLDDKKEEQMETEKSPEENEDCNEDESRQDDSAERSVHSNQHSSPVNIKFFSNLNLLPRKRPRETADEDNHDKEVGAPSSKRQTDEDSSPGEHQPSSLVQLLKSDPGRVMDLLSQALSMDSLSDLLKKEHRDSSAQLQLLRDKLEYAHKTMKQCTEQKGVLLGQIEEVTEEIQKKRQQLQSMREELRELGTQEGALKAKRDEANTKCSEVRRKLHASREALQQIQKIYGKKAKHVQKEIVTESS